MPDPFISILFHVALVVWRVKALFAFAIYFAFQLMLNSLRSCLSNVVIDVLDSVVFLNGMKLIYRTMN